MVLTRTFPASGELSEAQRALRHAKSIWIPGRELLTRQTERQDFRKVHQALAVGKGGRRLQQVAIGL